MAQQFQFTLESVQMTPPFKMTIIAPNGGRYGWEWATFQELKDWFLKNDNISDPDVILAWTMKGLYDIDNTMSQLPGLVGKTFELTGPNVVVLP